MTLYTVSLFAIQSLICLQIVWHIDHFWMCDEETRPLTQQIAAAKFMQNEHTSSNAWNKWQRAGWEVQARIYK